jgi:hypothetical protein
MMNFMEKYKFPSEYAEFVSSNYSRSTPEKHKKTSGQYTYNTARWKKSVANFNFRVGSWKNVYCKRREISRIPLKLSDCQMLLLSPGKHNDVQAAVVEEFAARFAQGSNLLYVGDTEKKDVYINQLALEK